MTQLIDDKRRLVMPSNFRPGDAVRVETTNQDTLVIRRMKPLPKPNKKIRFVRQKDGWSVLPGGPKLTTEDVKRILEDFP